MAPRKKYTKKDLEEIMEGLPETFTVSTDRVTFQALINAFVDRFDNPPTPKQQKYLNDVCIRIKQQLREQQGYTYKNLTPTGG